MLTTHSEEKAKQLENEPMTLEEEKQAQEEAHKHFVSVEFSHMLVEDGVASTFGKLSKEAQREIRAMITLQGEK